MTAQTSDYTVWITSAGQQTGWRLRNVTRAKAEQFIHAAREIWRDPIEDVYVQEHVTDLRSHEPPRNSGEGTAVNGPMPLGEKPDANAPT